MMRFHLYKVAYFPAMFCDIYQKTMHACTLQRLFFFFFFQAAVANGTDADNFGILMASF